jgi:glycoside/pentoside/hexuronide:cation symporter, GPH family
MIPITACFEIVRERWVSSCAGAVEVVPGAKRGAVSLPERIAYAGVYTPFSILHAPALAVLPALYAKHAHLNLVFIGTVLTLARVLDCALDPLIGFASDRTRSRHGRRKPWIVAGAVVSSIAAYFLFRPSSATGAVYFTLWYFLLYVGWTLGEIPHTAWLNEISPAYDERARLASYRVSAGYLGMLLFQLCAFLPWFASTEMTPAVTAAASWLVIGLMPATLLWAWIRVPDLGGSLVSRSSLATVLRGVRDNRPFWIFIASTTFSGIASGMVAGLFFFYLQDYLGIGEKFAHVQIIALLTGIAGSAFWLRMMLWIGKHRSLAICCFSTLLTLVGMAFVRPGPHAFPIIFTLFGVSAFASAGYDAAGWAMMADVVDYGTLKTGERGAGNYFAVTSFISKISLAAGGGMALVIVGLFGFSAEHPNGVQAMRGFFLAFIVIPIILNGAASVFAYAFPLDPRRQGIVRRRLQRRGVLLAAGSGAR